MAEASTDEFQEEILRRLDTMIAILRLAHADEIEHAKTKLLSDSVNAALLKATAGSKYVPSGVLKAKVMKETKQGTRRRPCSGASSILWRSGRWRHARPGTRRTGRPD